MPPTTAETIQVLKPNDRTCYLRIYVTHMGITQPMQDQLWSKAILYTKAFQRTHMSWREAGVLYHACFLPALTYSFLAMHLPDTFLEQIHKLSTSMILTKMGYHWKLPQPLVFIPCKLGGISLCNLVYEQSAQQVLITIRYLCARTPLVKQWKH